MSETNIERNYKVKLTASLSAFEELEHADKLKEVLKVPEESERQPDLSYITAVLVSSGMNMNGAYFLPYEILSAFDSIKHKPFNIEHDGQTVVGHMVDAVVVDRDANVLDVSELLEKEAEELNEMKLDVIISAVLYKEQFPFVVDDVKSGKYAVSMECYYSHYDIIIGGVIIPAAAAGVLDQTSGTECDIMHAGKALATVTVGRVLRNILFSGCGLVESPANKRSVILEAAKADGGTPMGEEDDDDVPLEEAAHIEITSLPPSVIDSSEVLSKLVRSNFEVSFAVYTGAHDHRFATGASATVVDGGHGHGIVHSELPKGTEWADIWDGGFHSHGISIDTQKTANDKEKHVHIVAVSLEDGTFMYVESGPPVKSHKHEVLTHSSVSYGGSHSHWIELPGGKVRTVFGKRSLKKFLSGQDKNRGVIEAHAGHTNVDGHPSSINPGQCVSFKRYVYGFDGLVADGTAPTKDKPDGPMDSVEQIDSIPLPVGGGAGDTVFQNMRIIHTNWCSLFDTECTTLGGDATSGNCLRNVLNTTTKELISSDQEQIIENRKKMKSMVAKIDNVLDKTNKVLVGEDENGEK